MTSQRPILNAACAALALAFAAGLTQAHAADAVGVDAMVRNSVMVKPADAASARPVVVRDTVRLGDAFTSGPQSSLQVLLRDQSVFTVGAGARVTIDRFVYDPSRNSSDVAASVTKGAFRFMSGRSLAGQGQRAISTPVATIGVRGTIVEGLVGSDVSGLLAGQPGLPPLSGDLDKLTLVVLRGPGVFNEGLDKPGAVDVTSGGRTFVLDRPGMAIVLFDGGVRYGPFFLSDAQAGRLAGLLVPGGAAGAPGGAGSGDFGGPPNLGSGDFSAPPGPPSPPPGAGGQGGDPPVARRNQG